MISVESRDGRKGLEQRFGSNKRETDDIELEEGEACSYQEEDDTSIDPDVALSYLDEKLQNVLGHFKKDFEGVVSIENLGAKYGTYGSFLPVYRRSPVSGHSRSPTRVQNHNTSQSLSTLRVEGGRHNSLVEANVPHSIKHGSASSYAHKPPSQNDLCRQTANTQSMQSTEEWIPKSEVRDQRTLKVRIKVGTDNLSVKKNAAIYSGLGLDNSPSSSFNDSPVDCGGLSHRLPSDSHESPTEILQVMTYSMLFGGCLLSPLPDHLVQLSERPKLLQDVLTQPSSKASQVDSVIGHPCYSPEEDNKKSSVENSMKLLDKKGSSLQVKKDSENSHIGFDFTVKETDIDSVCCEELVSSALKLPLLSDAYDTMGDSIKASPNQNIYFNAAEPLELMSIPSGKEDEKGNSAGNVTDRTANSSTKTDTVGEKSRKASKSGQKDSVKQKAEKSEQFSSGDKKKLKKSQVHGLERSLKQNILSKTWDKYKDFFGDMNDQELDVMDSSNVVENVALACENTSRDKISSFEIHKEVFSGTRLRGSSDNASAENGRSISDLAPGGVEADDKWVCCDKCQNWRLLPPGSRVDSLPEKWVCSMMTWLPDMNHCSISEEETTAAFRARYQLLAENASSLHVPLDSLATGMCSAGSLDCIVPNDGKMIDKLRKTSKLSFQDSPNRMPNSMKKKQQSAKARTSTENKESPLVNRSGFQQLTKSSGTYVETNQHERNHKRRADHDSDGGYAKMSKIKSKKELDEEPPKTSKKIKTQSIRSGDNDCNAVGKDKMAASELFPSRNSTHDMDGDMRDTFGKSKYQVEAFPDVTSLHVSKSGNNIAPKKRKPDNFQDPSSSTPFGKLTPDNEEFSRKKHRISRSEGKESSASKRNDKTGKNILHPGLDDAESLRKDSSGTRPFVASTSSSSKVSGSLKVKSKFHEVKGSPVESVSSSPLRVSNADKITSGSSKVTVEKDNAQDKNNKSDSEKGLVEMSESYDNLLDHAPLYGEKGRDNKIKVEEKLGSNADKADKDVICNNEELSIIPKSQIQKDYDEKRTSKKVDMVKRPDDLSTSTRDKSRHLGNGVATSSSSAHASDLQKEPQPNKKADSQNRAHNIPSKYAIANGPRGNNSDAPSPFRRDASTQAAIDTKREAITLKHLADRLKNDGSAESTGLYFEAALKFLHTASLLESGKTQNAKHVESMQMYSSTAKLCEYCAHEYERSKDMATASLAYKCMEVAYLRVIYSSHHAASRDRHDLQTALQMVPPGESPSSSASDIDNLNNSATADKAPPARSAGSPQLAANLVISARNRPNFSRLLSFAQDVTSAMEASRKSRITFAAANVSMHQGDFKDVIASMKTALDFNFHDVEGLLRLVRLAKEAASR